MTTTTTQHSRPECEGSKNAAVRARARTRLRADLVRLRRAAATLHRHTDNGNAAINAATDAFLLDAAKETLPVHERSRFIDRGAAIVSPKCYLCFQAMEASRPTGATAKLTCD